MARKPETADGRALYAEDDGVIVTDVLKELERSGSLDYEPSDTLDDTKTTVTERKKFYDSFERFWNKKAKPLANLGGEFPVPYATLRQLCLYDIYIEVVKRGGFSKVKDSWRAWSQVQRSFPPNHPLFSTRPCASELEDIKQLYIRYLVEFEKSSFTTRLKPSLQKIVIDPQWPSPQNVFFPRVTTLELLNFGKQTRARKEAQDRREHRLLKQAQKMQRQYQRALAQGLPLPGTVPGVNQTFLAANSPTGVNQPLNQSVLAAQSGAQSPRVEMDVKSDTSGTDGRRGRGAGRKGKNAEKGPRGKGKRGRSREDTETPQSIPGTTSDASISSGRGKKGKGRRGKDSHPNEPPAKILSREQKFTFFSTIRKTMSAATKRRLIRKLKHIREHRRGGKKISIEELLQAVPESYQKEPEENTTQGEEAEASRKREREDSADENEGDERTAKRSRTDSGESPSISLDIQMRTGENGDVQMEVSMEKSSVATGAVETPVSAKRESKTVSRGGKDLPILEVPKTPSFTPASPLTSPLSPASTSRRRSSSLRTSTVPRRHMRSRGVRSARDMVKDRLFEMLGDFVGEMYDLEAIDELIHEKTPDTEKQLPQQRIDAIVEEITNDILTNEKFLRKVDDEELPEASLRMDSEDSIPRISSLREIEQSVQDPESPKVKQEKVTEENDEESPKDANSPGEKEKEDEEEERERDGEKEGEGESSEEEEEVSTPVITRRVTRNMEENAPEEEEEDELPSIYITPKDWARFRSAMLKVVSGPKKNERIAHVMAHSIHLSDVKRLRDVHKKIKTMGRPVKEFPMDLLGGVVKYNYLMDQYQRPEELLAQRQETSINNSASNSVDNSIHNSASNSASNAIDNSADNSADSVTATAGESSVKVEADGEREKQGEGEKEGEKEREEQEVRVKREGETEQGDKQEKPLSAEEKILEEEADAESIDLSEVGISIDDLEGVSDWSDAVLSDDEPEEEEEEEEREREEGGESDTSLRRGKRRAIDSDTSERTSRRRGQNYSTTDAESGEERERERERGRGRGRGRGKGGVKRRKEETEDESEDDGDDYKFRCDRCKVRGSKMKNQKEAMLFETKMMVECEGCGVWHHVRCMKLRQKDLNNFRCMECRGK